MGHHGHDGHRRRYGPHSRGGGRHRARRGAIVTSVLLLLDERPMHGYELITELEARSEGRWRPSPGTMYPALTRMEEHDLIEGSDDDGKTRYTLTEVGRRRVAEFRDKQDDDTPDPWDETGRGRRGDLRGHVAELVGQARQIGRFGTDEQIESAAAILSDATRRLYAVLAAGPAGAPSDTGESGDTADEGNAAGD